MTGSELSRELRNTRMRVYRGRLMIILLAAVIFLLLLMPKAEEIDELYEPPKFHKDMVWRGTVAETDTITNQ